MIEYVTVRNFQRHKKRTLKFGKGVTAIVGDTNAGKSAIIRALRLAMLNKPNGLGQLRHGQETLSVEVGFDRIKLTRKKGKKKNVYGLEDMTYKAFGMGKVPKDISDQLKVDDVNFQRQMDPPFWFTETPGQIAKNLNAIVDLEVIDRSLSAAQSNFRSAKATADVCRQRLLTARAKRQELKWVPDMLVDWRRLEEQEAALAKTRQERTGLALLVAEATRHRRVKGRLKEVAAQGQETLLACEAVHVAGEVVTHLRGLLDTAAAEQKLADVDLPDFDQLQVIRADADAIAEKRRDLDLLVTEASKLEKELWRLKKDIKRSESTLRSAAPNLCPTCGQPTKSSSPRLATCTSH